MEQITNNRMLKLGNWRRGGEQNEYEFKNGDV